MTEKSDSPNIPLALLGLGSRTTVFYVQQLNRYYQQHNIDSTFPFLLLNSDFHQLNSYLPNQFDKLEKRLLFYLTTIQSLGATTVLLPNMTLHETYDRLKQRLGHQVIPCLHPVNIVINRLVQDKQHKILLIASAYSTHSCALHQAFTEAGVMVETPDAKTIQWIDQFRQRVYAHEEQEDEIRAFAQLVEQLSKSLPIVIACTELSLVLNDHPSIYDMARLQMLHAIHLELTH